MIPEGRECILGVHVPDDRDLKYWGKKTRRNIQQIAHVNIYSLFGAFKSTKKATLWRGMGMFGCLADHQSILNPLFNAQFHHTIIPPRKPTGSRIVRKGGGGLYCILRDSKAQAKEEARDCAQQLGDLVQ
jgi:hypothetical protein